MDEAGKPEIESLCVVVRAFMFDHYAPRPGEVVSSNQSDDLIARKWIVKNAAGNLIPTEHGMQVARLLGGLAVENIGRYKGSWCDLVVRWEADSMCNCGRMLYRGFYYSDPHGPTHPFGEDDEHHNKFWRTATPKDVIGEENARKLGLARPGAEGAGRG